MSASADAKEILLRMSVAFVLFRDPLLAAKHLATIDVLYKHPPVSCLCFEKQPA